MVWKGIGGGCWRRWLWGTLMRVLRGARIGEGGSGMGIILMRGVLFSHSHGCEGVFCPTLLVHDMKSNTPTTLFNNFLSENALTYALHMFPLS